MDFTSSPFLTRNTKKQTLVFDFNHVVASDHHFESDDDESSEVLIGKNYDNDNDAF